LIYYRDLVNKVIESKEGLAVAGDVLMSISKDERERAIFRSRRIALADRESNIAAAVLNKANTIAMNMLADGELTEKIMRYTGLTFGEVEKLRGAK
jgi:hypothetical protein